ncbi:MAG: signal peptide peptidase SppA [Ginsengibacter sp.]
MKNFLKMFLASFVAIVVFTILTTGIFLLVISALVSPDKPSISQNSVLVLDLSKQYYEQATTDPLAILQMQAPGSTPGVYDIVRMLEYAKSDSAIKGLYIQASSNPNGFGTSEELRIAVENFKQSGKFVIAYGETMDQKSYYVASAAQEIYCHPQGGLDWRGFSMNLVFFKGLLDKLEIEPQIFYAGKYKSATEPFRVKEMTEPNRNQTTNLLNDIYSNFLLKTSGARALDSTFLHRLAIDGKIQTATDALNAKLIDGLRYDDEVKTEILQKLGLKSNDKIKFVSLENYDKARDYKSTKGDRIALLYAEGEIVDGKSKAERIIASENFITLLRKIRLDKDVKAVVLRVNSPGGSALASDGIWREIVLMKKEKPVVVSMGDYAASGGYYIACAADSIFAEPGTLTGSIGVFGILPNFGKFFNDKLGVTFDGVKTAPYADMGNVTRPLTEPEKRMIQSSVDTIYHVFKSRVAEGRNLDMAFVDSIAQGHVYTGQRAVNIKLVDRIGYLEDAVRAAAALAKTTEYRLKEYPEKKNLLEQLMGANPTLSIKQNELKEMLGEEQYKYYEEIKRFQQMSRGVQARILSTPVIY